MKQRQTWITLLLSLLVLGAACAITDGPGRASRHRWWSGLGPVIPHDTFPADCTLCHLGSHWQEMVPDFKFDHEAETGFRLDGAHDDARCLRCHNDRGPVDYFVAQGCAGCHEDVHEATLGENCTSCHQQLTWQPVGMVAMHSRTRFPLHGVHASTSCQRCHPGAVVGHFLPVDTECVSCHQSDLLQTTNHLGLGWVDRCDRCHQPTKWELAEID
ncbi:MAG: hypothetical protein AAF682_03080 [Planctomycetota bacterium]